MTAGTGARRPASRRATVLGGASLAVALLYGVLAGVVLGTVPLDGSTPAEWAFAVTGAAAVVGAVLAPCLAAVNFSAARSAARATRSAGAADLIAALVAVRLVVTVLAIGIGGDAGDAASVGLLFLAVLDGLVLAGLALGTRSLVRAAAAG